MKRRANDINVTPLIDVLLVLLVIFMIAAPMMVRDVRVDIPQVVSVSQSKNVIQYDQIVTISLDANKNILLNGKKVTFDELIYALKSQSTEALIAVEASSSLSYQLIYSLLARVQDAGFSNIALTGYY